MQKFFRVYLLVSLLALPLALLAPVLHAQGRQPDLFTIGDPSPDIHFGTSATGQIGSAGRILSLAMAPDGQTMYAAAQISGVWKSTDSAKRWTHSSNGLRSGLTEGHSSLALDGKNPTRLLYATGDDDGRGQPGGLGPYGGLWVSDDSAATWSHVALCTGATNIQSVIFASGQPYVATDCGLFTTADAALATAQWTELSTWPNHTRIHEMADGGNQTLFTCSGKTVNRTANIASASPTQQLPITLSGDCLALAPAPVSGSGSSQSVVTSYQNGANQQVAVLNFQTNQPQPLALGSELPYRCCGAPQVRTHHILSAPTTATDAGLAYDVYAADGCLWWLYQPSPAGGSWQEIAAPESSGLDPLESKCSSPIHTDTWDMAFAPAYNPPSGLCLAFASTDGGVYANTGTESAVSGNCVSGWVLAQSGLHALNSMAMAGLTAGRGAPANLFLPSGDNSVWFRWAEGGAWASAGYLGDGGQVLIDPAFPMSVELSRNGHYFLTTGGNINSPTEITPLPSNAPCAPGGKSCYYDENWGSPGNGGIAAVPDFPFDGSVSYPGDYVAIAAVNSTAPTGSAMIVRCQGQSCLGPVQWIDVSPGQHFVQGAVKVLAAGTHTNPVFYLLTPGGTSTVLTPGAGASPNHQLGQLWRGTYALAPGGLSFVSWKLANGTGSASLTNPINFFVNPYDATELYALDMGNSAVKASHDSGATWKTEQTLTDFASNSQAGTGNPYRFDCHGSQANNSPYSPYELGCALSWITFDPNHLNVRVATSEFGGLAFSRDSGHDWMALNVTDNALSTNSPLTQEVNSAFYDGSYGEFESHFVPVIYAALHGSSMMSVAGPFPTLEQITMVVPPSTTVAIRAVDVAVSVGPSATVPLQRNGDGSFSGTFLFDYTKYPQQLSFQFNVGLFEGLPPETRVLPVSYQLSDSDKATGLASVTCTACSTLH
jgi:hypothetical protein